MATELKNRRTVNRTATETTIERVWLVEATQHNAVFNVLIPGIDIGVSYPGDSDYRVVNMSTEPTPSGGPDKTIVTVTYSNKADEEEEPGESGPVWSYSVDTDSETVVIDRDSKPIGNRLQGTERIFPRATATCRIYLDEGDADFLDYLGLVGTTNVAAFNGSAIGTYLYAGFDARRTRVAPGHDKWDITHRFWFRSYGWEHLWWYMKKKTKVTNHLSAEYLQAIGDTNYARLYETGDFSLLDI